MSKVNITVAQNYQFTSDKYRQDLHTFLSGCGCILESLSYSSSIEGRRIIVDGEVIGGHHIINKLVDYIEEFQ